MWWWKKSAEIDEMFHITVKNWQMRTEGSLSCWLRESFPGLPPLSVTVSVHNWTMEDTVQWLKESVELPQYEKNFRDFHVTGNTLPRWVGSNSNPVWIDIISDVCDRWWLFMTQQLFLQDTDLDCRPASLSKNINPAINLSYLHFLN